MMVGRGLAGVGLVVAAAMVIGGCGSDTKATGSASGPVRTAPWAEEVVLGEQLWQTSSEGLTLTAYSMGEDTAQYDSRYSDDVTNEPLVTVGDPLVFVNVVVTNTSDQTKFVFPDQPELLAAPRESPYQEQGVARVARTTDAQWQDHSVWYHTVRTGADTQKDADEPSPWRLAPGESCAMGYALPLSLGREWGFIAVVRVDESIDEPGQAVTFEQQNYTFS